MKAGGKKSFVCCICAAHVKLSVESNGVCITLVMQVNGSAEMSVLCVLSLVQLSPLNSVITPLNTASCHGLGSILHNVKTDNMS